MKIIMNTEFNGDVIIHLIKENGMEMIIRGNNCKDFAPNYGCQLNKYQFEELKKWMIKND